MATWVGDAIDALVTLLAPAVAPVPVNDGPVVTEDPMQKVVGVGWDGDADGDMAALDDWTQEVASFESAVTETFEVVGYVSCWAGDDTAIKARRDEALALLDLVQAVILANPTLGLSGAEAKFIAAGLFQEAGQYGKQARIRFVVTVRVL